MNFKSENNGKIILHDQQLKLIYSNKRKYQQKYISLVNKTHKSNGKFNISYDSNSILSELKLNRNSKSKYEKLKHYTTQEISIETTDIHLKSDIISKFNFPIHSHTFNIPIHNIHTESGLENARHRRKSLRSNIDTMRSNTSDNKNNTRISTRAKSMITSDNKTINPYSVDLQEAPTPKYQTNPLEHIFNINLKQRPSSCYKAFQTNCPKAVGYTSRSSFSCINQIRQPVGKFTRLGIL